MPDVHPGARSPPFEGEPIELKIGSHGVLTAQQHGAWSTHSQVTYAEACSQVPWVLRHSPPPHFGERGDAQRCILVTVSSRVNLYPILVLVSKYSTRFLRTRDVRLGPRLFWGGKMKCIESENEDRKTRWTKVVT